MSRNPTFPDLVDRIKRLEDQVRNLRIASKAKTETKTFIVSGSISSSLYIPPVGIAVNLDGTSLEWKEIIGLGGQMRTGTGTFRWLLNNQVIYTGHVITSNSWSGVLLEEPIKLNPGWHSLLCDPTAGSGQDLSIGYAAATGR